MPEDRLAVAPVWRHVDVEHVVCDLKRPGEGRALAGVCGQDEKPARVVRKPELLFGQSMPTDSTPRSVFFSMTTPPGSCAPGTATGTFCPFATLGAPQTMGSTLAPRIDPAQRRACPRKGAARISTISPTQTSVKAGANASTASTSSPRMVSLSASPWRIVGDGHEFLQPVERHPHTRPI